MEDEGKVTSERREAPRPLQSELHVGSKSFRENKGKIQPGGNWKLSASCPLLSVQTFVVTEILRRSDSDTRHSVSISRVLVNTIFPYGRKIVSIPMRRRLHGLPLLVVARAGGVLKRTEQGPSRWLGRKANLYSANSKTRFSLIKLP